MKWLDVIRYAKRGNPKPLRRVEKTEAEWKAQLTEEQYYVTRQKGTERAFTGEHCGLFEPGIYSCVCCDSLLFDGSEKFESGTGWPSFTEPIFQPAIKYEMDMSHGMRRVEVMCNVCDGHLGHVFNDGPAPTGLRFCINSASMKKKSDFKLEKLVIGGGCFWCTEAMFQTLRGVEYVEPGYSGGTPETATYKQVCNGTTSHAEVIQITYDPAVISYDDLIRMHFLSHDPTTLNRQGNDVGPQYRSAIFYKSEEEKEIAAKIMAELQADFANPIVTTLEPYEAFYKAEDYHHDYYAQNSSQPYCDIVITPKLLKFRQKYAERMKDSSVEA